MVTQYDVELFQRLEALLEKKMETYKTEKETVMLLQERVSEAQRAANLEMKEMELGKDNHKKRGPSNDKGASHKSKKFQKRK